MKVTFTRITEQFYELTVTGGTILSEMIVSVSMTKSKVFSLLRAVTGQPSTGEKLVRSGLKNCGFKTGCKTVSFPCLTFKTLMPVLNTEMDRLVLSPEGKLYQ